MSTIKSLRFDISSSWDGAGMRGARDDVERLNADIKKLSDKNVKINVDDAAAVAKVDEIKARLQALSDKAVKLSADSRQIDTTILDVKARLAALQAKPIELRADGTQAKAEIDRLKAELLTLRSQKVQIDVDTHSAGDEVDKLSEDMRRFEERSKAAAETATGAFGGFRSAMDAVVGKMDTATASAGSLVLKLVTMGPIVVGLGALFLGLGGAMVSSFGLATLALVPFGASIFGTVSSAVKLNQALAPLNTQLEKQKDHLATLTQGSAAYKTAQAGIAQTQDQINQAMAGATPVQQQVATSLNSLSQEWKKFQTQAEKFTGPVLASGFKLLGDILPSLLPIIQSVAPIFQSILDKADAFAKGNGMQVFVAWIIAVGVPNLKNILDTIGHLFVTVYQVMTGFASNGLGFSQWLSDITGKLNSWGSGGGFERFADKIKQDWPQVKKLLDDGGDAIKNITKALASFGPGSLTVFGTLVGLVSKLSPTQLRDIAVAILAIRAAILATAIVQGILTGMSIAMGLWSAACFIGFVATGLIILELLLIVVVLAAIAFGIYELVTHWTTAWNFIKQIAAQVWQWLQTAWRATVQALKTAWDAVSAALKSAWNAVWNWLKTTAQTIWNALKTAWNAVVQWLKTAWDTVSSALKTAWNATWNWLKSTAQTIWDALKTAWNAFINAMKTVWDTVSSALKTAWTTVWDGIKTAATTVWDALKTAWNTFINALKTAWDTVSKALSGAFKSLWTTIESDAKAIWSKISDIFKAPINVIIGIWDTVAGVFHLPQVSKLASGGHVTGPGGGTDDRIPAMLSNGEFVMKAAAVSHYGLDKMHAMNAMHLAAGGPVTPSTSGGMAGQAAASAGSPAGGGIVPGANGSGVPGSPSTPGTQGGTPGTGGLSISGLLHAAATVAYDIAKPLLDAVVNSVPGGGDNGIVGLPHAGIKIAVTDVENILKGKQDAAKAAMSTINAAGNSASGPGAPSSPVTGNLQSWLKAAGIPQSQWGAYATLVQAESGGNPSAYNPQGTSSGNAAGLTQVTSGTFAAYGGGNVYNPVDNLKASYKYIQATYGGNVASIPGLGTSSYKGYALGTSSAIGGWSMVGENGPEMANLVGGGQVKSFDDTVAAISSAGPGHGVGSNIEVNVTGNTFTGTPEENAQAITDSLLPQLSMLLNQGVGSR